MLPCAPLTGERAVSRRVGRLHALHRAIWERTRTIVRATIAYAVAPPATNATTPRTKPFGVNHCPSPVSRRWIVKADAPNDIAIKKSMNAKVSARPRLETAEPTLLTICEKSAELATAITAEVIAQSAVSAAPPKWRLRYIAAVTNTGTIRSSGIGLAWSGFPLDLRAER